MNQLITASIGLYYDKKIDAYYLQVITATNETNTLFWINKQDAISFSQTEMIEIEELA